MADKNFLWTIWFIIRNGLFRGTLAYFSLLGGLAIMTLYGLYAWIGVQHAPLFLGTDAGGLVVTGLSDSVMWGIYISFFSFWVGIAFASIAFIIMAYVFNHEGFKKVAGIAEAQAVAGIAAGMLLILVDIGNPMRALILMPQFSNPRSMLNWDMATLSIFVLVNLVAFLVTVHYSRTGREVPKRFALTFTVLAVLSGVAARSVSGFLAQALTARPFWNSPLLAPKFFATAFASGVGLLLLTLVFAEWAMNLKVDPDVYRKGIYIIVGSLIVGLYFMLSELEELFWYTAEPFKAAQASIALFGVEIPYFGFFTALWIGLACGAVLVSLIPGLKDTKAGIVLISTAAFFAVVGEKVTAIAPAYIPDALGRVVAYFPTPIEVSITVGISALGLLLHTVLSKVAAKAVQPS